MFEPFLQQGVFLLGIIAGGPLLCSTLVSLVVGIFQAATQIQEQTLGHLVRFITVAAVLALGWNYFLVLLTTFLQDNFNAIATVGRSF